MSGSNPNGNSELKKLNSDQTNSQPKLRPISPVFTPKPSSVFCPTPKPRFTSIHTPKPELKPKPAGLHLRRFKTINALKLETNKAKPDVDSSEVAFPEEDGVNKRMENLDSLCGVRKSVKVYLNRTQSEPAQPSARRRVVQQQNQPEQKEEGKEEQNEKQQVMSRSSSSVLSLEIGQGAVPKMKTKTNTKTQLKRKNSLLTLKEFLQDKAVWSQEDIFASDELLDHDRESLYRSDEEELTFEQDELYGKGESAQKEVLETLNFYVKNSTLVEAFNFCLSPRGKDDGQKFDFWKKKHMSLRDLSASGEDLACVVHGSQLVTACEEDWVSNVPIPLHAINVSTEDEEDVQYVSEYSIRLSEGNRACKGSGLNRTQSAKVYSTYSNSSEESELPHRGSIKTTYYDEDQNARIQIVSNIRPCEEVGQEDQDDVPKKKSQIQYIIKELIETEITYSNTLRHVIVNYKNYMESLNLPQHDRKLVQTIFAKLPAIYEGTLKLLARLNRIADKDWHSLAVAFMQEQNLFNIYPDYLRSKAINDRLIDQHFMAIVLDRQSQLKESLDLSSFLLTPLQRLSKYKLLLENILKELKAQGTAPNRLPILMMAIRMVDNKLRRAETLIVIDSIEKAPVMEPSKFGDILLKEVFTIKAPKKRESTLFLFQKVLIFTTPVPNGNETFRFEHCVSLSEMCLVLLENEKLIFHVKQIIHKVKKKSSVTYVIQAKTPNIKKLWTRTMYDLLFQQLKRAKQKRKSSTSSEQDLK